MTSSIYEPAIDCILSNYLKESAPIFFLAFDQRGGILLSNRYTREVLGLDPKKRHVDDVFVNFPSEEEFPDLSNRQETLLNVRTLTDLPLTYYFRFFAVNDMMLALGRLDYKEMEQLRENLMDLTTNLSDLNRRLNNSNAKLLLAGKELEQRVEQRTSELSQSNARLLAGNEERKRAQEALNKSEKELMHLSSRILNAHEEERKRIAGDLHDGLAQTLSAVQVWLSSAAEEICSDEKAAVQSLHAARELAQDAINEIQRISRNLRPAMLDNLGLAATLNWLWNGFGKIHSDISIDTCLDVTEHHVPESLKIVIFRVFQEALNNIAKHSKATAVSLSLTEIKGKGKRLNLKLSVRDNGRGFYAEHQKSRSSSGGGLGLDIMKERAELSGGSFLLRSQPGTGTTIEAEWPV